MRIKRLLILILLIFLVATCVVTIFSIPTFPSLQYLSIVEKYCNEYEVDVYIVLATIEIESGGNKYATSKVGAMGLMQLMPNTAQWMATKLGVEIVDYYDEETNIMLGVAYINYLKDRFSGDFLFCAYNAGEGVVKEWIKNGGEILYPETKAYVVKMNNMVRKLKNYIYLY